MAEKQNGLLTFFDRLLRVGLGFLKAQLIFFVINLVLITLFLLLFGVQPAVLIAIGISLLDLLPVVGSGIVFLPWIIVNLILGEQGLALQLALLYIGLVILRQVLDPLITGKQVGLKPVVALLAAVAGVLVFGIAGAVIGPLIAAVVNIILDLRRMHQPPPAADVPPGDAAASAQEGSKGSKEGSEERK